MPLKKRKDGKPRLARTDKEHSIQISATLPFSVCELVRNYAYTQHLTFSAALAMLVERGHAK